MIRTEPGLPSYIHSATTYDEHNNAIEVILGGCGINSGPNRWVRTYDSQGHMLADRQYEFFNRLLSLDSLVFNEHGKMTTRYWYDYRTGQPVLGERLVFVYDSSDNLLEMSTYKGAEQKLWHSNRFTYNKAGQLTENNSYSYANYETEKQYMYTSYSYHTKGLLVEKKMYQSDRDFQYVELPKPAIIKWVYSFYK